MDKDCVRDEIVAGFSSHSRRKALATVAALSAAVVLPGFAQRPGRAGSSSDQIHQADFKEIYHLSRAGKSRQFTTFDPASGEKAVVIGSGEKIDLIRYEGAGIPNRLWMTLSGWFWQIINRYPD